MVGIKGKTISWLANDSAFYGEVFFWNQIFVVDIQKGMGKTVPLKTNFYFFFLSQKVQGATEIYSYTTMEGSM